jgi:tRNA pseudouridine55 synthase
VLVVDKPAGMTSHDVVEALRPLEGVRRAGHAGTLDPMATGVLLVCINEATKASRYLMEGEKEYLARVRLGLETDTQDLTGRVLREQGWTGVSAEAIATAASAFLGEVSQIPPMYSAVKRGGVRLHVLARRGETVERPARKVRIRRIDIEEVALPEATLRIACSKGTYVRTLVHDLGRRVGCGAALAALVRTRSGGFTIGEAIPLGALIEGGGKLLAGRLVPLPEALDGWTPLRVDAEAAGLAARGRPPPPPPESPAGERIKILSPDGALVALAETVEERSGRKRLRTIRVFNCQSDSGDPER